MKADLFSLGLVLLGALTGWHPLDPPDVLEPETPTPLLPGTHVEMEPAIPLGILTARLLNFGAEDVERTTKKLDVRLRRIIAKALQVEPSERYPSALSLAEDLRGYLRDSWPRYQARELTAELALLIRAARKLKEPVAYSVTESGVLPAPVDQPWDGP